MYSIKFPDMFGTAVTNLVEDHEATISNMRLLLASWKTSLFGDPYFGTKVKEFIYEQNNVILHDIIIDNLYTSLKQFIPQVHLTRKDITIVADRTSLYATINCINKIDNQPDMFSIELMVAE